MANDKPKREIFLLPEGLVVVEHLLERDIYTDDKGVEGKPKYQIVSLYEPKDVIGEGTIEDKMADAIAAAFGDATADEWLAFPRRADRISPLKDGDKVADQAQLDGKDREINRGKIVLTADCLFDKEGKEGPAGMKCYGPDGMPYNPMTHGPLYAGMYGIAAVTLHAYKDFPRKGDRGLKCFLVAFQKTRDGEPLKAAAGSSTDGLFKPVAGATSAPAEGGRRRRAG